MVEVLDAVYMPGDSEGFHEGLSSILCIGLSQVC